MPQLLTLHSHRTGYLAGNIIIRDMQQFENSAADEVNFTQAALEIQEVWLYLPSRKRLLNSQTSRRNCLQLGRRAFALADTSATMPGPENRTKLCNHFLLEAVLQDQGVLRRGTAGMMSKIFYS